ncbi:MAG: lamin tail domain-containing protein [Candidatus Sungbacteria bacterium]|uniref:Lamin tail domain-containing protein n=1 Tax=Candidatus Sungiibacteriota bacterium TaxID=2750080 RepID=A0A9D6LP52_9BACT|nr:lamin tail domain-containing protein [Candidatus Sungbacteria bacterium]
MDIAKTDWRRGGLYVWFLLFSFPSAALAGSVAINEVLFDPAGSDTGQEIIEFYNAGSDDVDLSGWQVYPDGIGYFIFPSGANIAAHSFLTLNLRKDGLNTASTYFFPGATANMGNSSGSAALFTAGDRTKDTIRTFVRYQKPGSAERKTWESTAADAGLWTVGQYVDISNFSEGGSIGLVSDGAAMGASAWKIYAAPTVGQTNSAAGGSDDSGPQNSDGSSTPESTAPQFSVAPLYTVPRLDVSITAESNGIIGAPHTFLGKAWLNKKPVTDHVRFLWNFDDGAVMEGPGVSHTFAFPGVYTVSLSVNSEEAVGSENQDVSITENHIALANVEPGADGFVSLINHSAVEVDLSGWMLKGKSNTQFTLPKNTFIRQNRTLILPNKTTGLDAESIQDLAFFYPNGVIVSAEPAFSIGQHSVAIASLADSGSSVRAINTSSRSLEDPRNKADLASVAGDRGVQAAATSSLAAIGLKERLRLGFLVGGMLLALLSGFGAVFLRRVIS